ncbi:MAG: class I SAM-dependent methyltransferase [Gallionellaceae bacterium]|nr:class I SAM-dependent methyltransferase [Gallionellaceae bacterium]
MTDYKDHFSADAKGYALYRPDYPAELFAFLAGQLKRHELAWDCATGNGQAACGLARHFREVVGTDASTRQIEHAVAHPAVSYRMAAAENSGLEAASVDLVTVAQAAHWFDLPLFYDEVKRVSRPGGVLALWCYERLGVDPGIDPLIEYFYTHILGPYWPPERRWVEGGYRDLPFPFQEERVPAFEMRVEWSLDQLMGYFATWSAVKAYRAATNQDPLPALRASLETRWISNEGRKTIKWPLSLRLGRVAVA